MNLPIDIKCDVKANFTKPVTILIQKIANATGVVYEPTRIVRKAKAESEAKLIKARTDMEVKRIKKLGELELNDIQQRSVASFVYQQERKQHNIEQIMSLALPQIPEDAPTENIDEDWLAYFFAHCELVSDKDMQSLWANLLTGEARKPNSFSKRTIDFIATMSKEDAKLFTHFCQFSISVDGQQVPFIFINKIVIYNYRHIYYIEHIYTENKINNMLLTHLESIGLIKVDKDDLLLLSFDNGVFYFDKPILINQPNSIITGHIMFTQIGKELSNICGAVENKEFYNYIESNYEKIFENFHPNKY
jgi:hypothetical protein